MVRNPPIPKLCLKPSCVCKPGVVYTSSTRTHIHIYKTRYVKRVYPCKSFRVSQGSGVPRENVGEIQCRYGKKRGWGRGRGPFVVRQR